MKIRIRKPNSFLLLPLLVVALTVILPVPVFADYAEGMNHYRKAWAAYATQDFDQAKRRAEEAVRADADNAHAHALLGNLAYLSHDLPAARAAWGRALEIQPQLRELYHQIAQAEEEMALEKELVAVTLGSLIVRVPREEASSAQGQQGAHPQLPGVILAVLGEAVEGLAPYFQYRVERPLTVLVYPRERFYEMNHVPTEVLGLFDGKIRVPSSLMIDNFQLMIEGPTHSQSSIIHQQSSMVSVLWHEYAHAVVYDLSNGRAPRWLQEGLAQECERLAVDVPSSTIHHPSSVSLRALLGVPDRFGEPAALPAQQFYAASHSLVRYLLQARGWDRMRAFLKGLGAGRSVEEALGQVYGWDLDGLEKRWRAAVAR